MNVFAAASTGAGLGLAYYGGLWWTLAAFTPSTPRLIPWLTLSRIARLALAWLVFYALMNEGIVYGLAGFVGLLLMRWYLLRRIGGTAHG